MTTITVRLEEAEKQALAEYAKKNDLSMSQVIRQILKDYLKNNQ